MKKNLILLTIFLFNFQFVFAQNPEEKGNFDPIQKENNAPKAIPGQFIVVLKEKPVIANTSKKTSENRSEKEMLNKAAREQVTLKINAVKSRVKLNQNIVLAEYADVLSGFAAKLDKAQVDKLQADPDVAAVYQDYEISIGDYEIHEVFDKQDDAQVVPCAVSQAGGSVNGSSKSTVVWILDTGADMDHPDLNLETSPELAKSFVTGETVEDGNGHGTHCAGIVGGKDNGVGTIGVSSGARIIPLKVLANSGAGSFSTLIAGLNHVAKFDKAGDVVNMSLGTYGVRDCENANPTLRDAIRNLGNAGTWVVISSGNDFKDSKLALPGCINGNKVLTVGAMTCEGTCAKYSNINPTTVDWIAVGSNVYSTYKNGGYATMSGTSMAAPVVSGILHSKNALPVSAGEINCRNVLVPFTAYKKARR
jgi:subtilisin family serine protease